MITLMRTLIAALLLAALSSASAFAQDEEPQRRQKYKSDEPVVLYVEFDPVTVSIRGESRVEGLMSIRYSLEVIGEDKAAYVTARRPRLTGAVTLYLTRYGKIGVDPKKKPNIDVLDAIIQRAVDSVLGENEADVMVLEVNTRPL